VTDAILDDISALMSASTENLMSPRSLSVTEEALRDSEERYQLLLDGIQNYAIFMMDPVGIVTSWNAGAERIKGYKAAEIIGQNFSCFFPEKEIQRGRPSEVLLLAATGGRHVEHAMRRRKDGSLFLASVTFAALRDSAGRLKGFSEFSHDLTASVESEARYRGLLEAAPDAMVVVDATGAIVLSNYQAEIRFGYRAEELLGRPVTTIIPHGFAERLAADSLRSAEAIVTQQIGTGIELQGRRKDGSDFPIEIMLSPLASPEGTLVTAAIRDISTRKSVEAELIKNVQHLNRSNEELEQFANIASHDLQEPLRMVAAYTQLLAERYKGRLDSDADEFIAYAVDGSLRMRDLIQDLLTYSRAGANGKPHQPVSSDTVLKTALANLAVAIEESGALITHDVLPTLTTDETQLAQVFQNLLGNAIKYHGIETPKIHVSARRNTNAEWVFSVRDNGIGIDPEYFESIFVIFHRLHGRDEYEGTGLGLAICKKMLERLGGRIWVESQPPNGSTFYFALPAKKDS
jgi:PAS domain S-box-containing protein